MALKRHHDKKFRWNIYTEASIWAKVVTIQELRKYRSRQNVIDEAINLLYDKCFPENDKKEK